MRCILKITLTLLNKRIQTTYSIRYLLRLRAGIFVLNFKTQEKLYIWINFIGTICLYLQWLQFFFLLFCFQVGRSSESPIDFVVMDTLPGDKKDAKVMQSTISRFACRILVERTEAPKAKIYAAGFDSSRNIFLGVSLVQ